jgi:hypothetical protein
MEFAIDCPQRTHSLVVSGATFRIGDIGGAVGVRTSARPSNQRTWRAEAGGGDAAMRLGRGARGKRVLSLNDLMASSDLDVCIAATGVAGRIDLIDQLLRTKARPESSRPTAVRCKV